MSRTSWIQQTVLFFVVAFVLCFTIQHVDAAGFFRRVFRPNVVYRKHPPRNQHQANLETQPVTENNIADVNAVENDTDETPQTDEELLYTDADNFVESESDGLMPAENIPAEATVTEEPTEEVTEESLELDGLTLTETERHVYEYTNVERKRRGLSPLKLNRRLVESARRQAKWMAQTGVFRHGNSGFAENIAMGQPSPQAVVRAWMNSSGHMRNMMNRYHGCIGIGAVQGRNGQLYWCQQFSR